MTQLDFTNSSRRKAPKRRKTVAPKTTNAIYVGPTFLIFTLVLMVCMISVMTLMFSTTEITKGYTLKKLEAEHEQLLRDNEAKTMHVAEVRSLAVIKSSSKVQEMVWPRKITYYRGDTAIASK
jgi:hypothetical protein